LSSADLDIPDPSTQTIYITEHLSKSSKQLYNEARTMRNERIFQFVWTKAGKIYVRRNEHQRAIRISSSKMLNDVADEFKSYKPPGEEANARNQSVETNRQAPVTRTRSQSRQRTLNEQWKMPQVPATSTSNKSSTKRNNYTSK